MAERRPRGEGARGRGEGPAWRETGEAVSVEQIAIGAELAREAANPFGVKLPAHELLARFGGEGPHDRARASAALELAGVVADPPLADVEPHQFVALRRAEPPAVAAPGATAVPSPNRTVVAGVLGVGALALVIAVAVALRGVAGGGEERGGGLPPAGAAPTPATVAAPAATTKTTTTTPAPAPSSRDRAPAAPDPSPPAATPVRRPATVRLRVVPTEPSYVCVADGRGRTLFHGMLTEPYAVRRPKLIVRIGVATARIAANGREVRVTTAPAAFELTPRATRELPGDALVCGG